jgi:hypothetical protein
METDREARFFSWLREEAGIAGPRRVVRDDPSGILVSKFEDGFAARLLAAVESLRDVLDTKAVNQAFLARALLGPTVQRVDCWADAVRGLLGDAAESSRITADQRAEIEAGVDSVALVLSSVLWTGPAVSTEYNPCAGERAAYLEVLDRMNAEHGLFDRHYGVFEGVPVFNHCPGARVARRLLAQSWTICTGLPEPTAPYENP